MVAHGLAGVIQIGTPHTLESGRWQRASLSAWPISETNSDRLAGL